MAQISTLVQVQKRAALAALARHGQPAAFTPAPELTHGLAL